MVQSLACTVQPCNSSSPMCAAHIHGPWYPGHTCNVSHMSWVLLTLHGKHNLTPTLNPIWKACSKAAMAQPMPTHYCSQQHVQLLLTALHHYHVVWSLGLQLHVHGGLICEHAHPMQPWHLAGSRCKVFCHAPAQQQPAMAPRGPHAFLQCPSSRCMILNPWCLCMEFQAMHENHPPPNSAPHCAQARVPMGPSTTTRASYKGNSI